MQHVKVTYIGLNNLFSRVTTLLLKQSPVVSKLILYGDQKFNCQDELTTAKSDCQILSYCDRAQIFEALEGVDIVLIGDELIKPNNNSEYEITASKLYDYAKAIAQVSPEAFLVVAASPINVFMPFIAQLYSQLGCLNAGKLIGASTVDTVRANGLLAAQLRMDPTSVVLPVVGGCSPLTRVPLFSHAYPSSCVSYISSEKKRNIINKIRNNEKSKQDDAIEKAYATVRLIHSISAAITGPTQIPEIALVKNYSSLNVEYFALPLLIGKKGVEKVFTLKNITKNEERMVNTAIENMNLDVDKAKDLLSMQGMENDDVELCNEEEDCVFVSDVNFKNEESQKGQKRTSEKDFKSTKVEEMVPLHCPAEPYLETPSATRQKNLEKKKTPLGWRLIPPYGIKKKNIGDFNDDSDFTNFPGIHKYLKQEDKKDDRSEEIEETQNHSMKASDDDDDKGNLYKFPDDMQTEFTLDNEADIENIKHNLRKSIEAIKTYNKAQKRNNNETDWDENLDDTVNQVVNEEPNKFTPTNFKNKFTNVNEENNYLEEDDAGEGDHHQQRGEDCPTELRQKGTDGNTTMTKHPAGNLESPPMDAEYRILLVEPNVHESETSEISQDIQNYDIKYLSEEAVPKSKHVKEPDQQPSSLIMKINDKESTLKQKQPSKQKLESKETYFQNSKTISKFDMPLKDTDKPETPSRAINSENLETYSVSMRNEKNNLLNIYDSKPNMPEKFIPNVAKDVIKIETDLDKRNKGESYVMKVNKNKNVLTQPASRLYDEHKQNVVRIQESPASKLYDNNRQNVVRAKESTNNTQDVERNNDQNVKVHSYSIFGKTNNRITWQSADYLTERSMYKRQVSKQGEGNSSAPKTTFTLNKNGQQNFKFHKENTSKLQNLNKNKYEIQKTKITETTKIQRNDYQKSRQFSPKSKSPSQSKAQSNNFQKSKPFSSKSNSLSQSNAHSNNFQSFSPISKSFPSNVQPIDSQKSSQYSPKSKSLTERNAQYPNSRESKPFSPKSESQTQSSAQHTDTQKSKPFSPKSESPTPSNAQPTVSQKSKPFSPKSKSLTQSSAQPTDTQKSKPFSPKSKSHTQDNAQPIDSEKSKLFSPKSKSHAESSSQPIDSEKSKPFSPKLKSLTQSSAQPTDTQKSIPFSPKSKSHTQDNAQPTDSQKSKPISPKSKLHAESSSQPIDSEKSKPFSPKSKSLTQSSAQPADTQKSKPLSSKSKSHTQDNAQPADTHKSKPLSSKSKSHTQDNAQPADTHKSKPLSSKSKSHTQDNAQPADTHKSKPLSSKSKFHTQDNAQPADTQKSKPLSSKSKSHIQDNAQPTDAQKSKPFTPKSKLHVESSAQPADSQKSNPPSPKSKIRSQSKSQSIDSQKFKPLSSKSKSFSQSTAPLIDSRKSELHSQMSKRISQTAKKQSFGSQQSKPFVQTHDSEETDSPTEINNIGSGVTQKSKYHPNDQQQSSISSNKFPESMVEQNVKEIEKGQDHKAATSITHKAVAPTCSLNTINHAISNLINPKTYLSENSLDQLRGVGNVEHADKQKDNSSSKKINGKHEMLKAKTLSQKTENNNSRSISSQVKRHEAANDLTESKLNKEVEYKISSNWAPFTININKIGHLKKTATPSLNTENEKIKEIKQQGLKMERFNKGANMKAVQSKVNGKINVKNDPTTNLQLIHQIKLEEKKLMLAQGTVNKKKQQFEKSKISYSGKKYKPGEKTDNTVEINTSKVAKKVNKQTNTEQNVKVEKQFSKVLNIEKTKFTDHNIVNRKSQKTQLNQYKDVKRKQKEVKSEAVYNKQEHLQTIGKTHKQNKNPCERTVDEQWANTEFPHRKLSIKPIVPIKPKLIKNKIKVALNPVKISLPSNNNLSNDYDVKLINRPLSDKMNRSKFVFSDSKASLTTLTEYNRILFKNNALTKNAPIHPIKYSIKSIIEEEQNNKNMQLGKIGKMGPTFRDNGIAINDDNEDRNEKKVDLVNVKNNNADKKYKIWCPSEDGKANKVEKVEKEKKISSWGGRLFQLFKNVISRDLDDEQTRTQISNNCLKLKENLPPVNDLRTKVFIANKVPGNWKNNNMNNERSLHKNYDNKMIDNLKINETNRSSSLNKTSRKVGRDNKLKGSGADDRLSSSINSQKMGNFNTETHDSIGKRKKEVMAYFGKKVTYNHNLDADSMDNLSTRMMDCRPYRKPARLMSRFKPLYNHNNSNDN